VRLQARNGAAIVATATVAAASLLISTSRPVEAVAPEMDSASVVIDAAGPSYVNPADEADGSRIAAVGPSTIRFPEDNSADLTIDDIGVGIPGQGQPAVVAGDGSVAYGGADRSSDTVVQTIPDGARMLVVLKDQSAPTEYHFPIRLPANASLVRAEDGSVLVTHPEEGLLANIDAPWANDANGTPVPTDYRIEGNTVVQTVRTGPATVYPVVADPVWIPLLVLLTRIILAQGIKSFSRHALQRMAQRGISRQMIEQAVKNGRRSSGGTSDTVKFTHGKIWVVVNKDGNVVSVGWK
jgi:hypothetical protein